MLIQLCWGAVLVQEQGDEHRIINYESRSLSGVERRYSQTEKEALAIVWFCERFHAYLYGAEFELIISPWNVSSRPSLSYVLELRDGF